MSIIRDNVHSSHQNNNQYYLTTIFIYLKYYSLKSVYSGISDNRHNDDDDDDDDSCDSDFDIPDIVYNLQELFQIV